MRSNRQGSDEWKKTVQGLQLPPGVKADLWAAEPHVANIVSFAFDEKGRCFVAETFRLHAGVTDNRSHMDWLDDDIACRTVGDRVAMYKKYLKGKFPTYEKEHRPRPPRRGQQGDRSRRQGERIRRRLYGRRGRHRSGVLAKGGSVWYTCIPDLWLPQGHQGRGPRGYQEIAPHRLRRSRLRSSATIRTACAWPRRQAVFLDRRPRAAYREGRQGARLGARHRAVLRCNPDGSELEIVATGLRNPQELAFDEFGNLFTGTTTRTAATRPAVQIVEGGDSGWRIGYQYLPGLGAWNSEKVWHTPATNTASYVVPPLAHIANGPSGLTYHPGTSLLPEKYQKHFFLCDFRGSGGGSGVHSFALKPKGASFELVDRQQFVWSVLATIATSARRRILRQRLGQWLGPHRQGPHLQGLRSGTAKDPAVAETKKLLAEGFKKTARMTNW